MSKGKRFKYGKGIYSTPSIEVAAKYAQVFETKEGEKYMLVMQNRVCPTDLIKIEAKKTHVGEYWVTPQESYIRPYGVCLKKCK